jgi:hypothetical protein
MKRWGLFGVPFLTLLACGAAFLHGGRGRPQPAPRHPGSASASELQFRQNTIRHWRVCLLQH